VKPSDAADAHRPLGKEHDLAVILSHVEQRQVTNDYTVRFDAKVYQIDRRDIRTGMRKAWVRVEARMDGTIAVRFQDRYVRVRRCVPPLRELAPLQTMAAKPPRPTGKPKGKSDWMKNFSVRSGPSLRQAIEVSNARR
jgi:hypothetical protein